MIVTKKTYDSVVSAYEEALSAAESELEINRERVSQLQEELAQTQTVQWRKAHAYKAVQGARAALAAAREEQARVEEIFKEAITTKWVEFRLSDRDEDKTKILRS